MPWLLNILYVVLLTLASPWLLWQGWRKGKYREGFAEKFLGRVPKRDSQKRCVWLHAVSVGEVNLLGTLIEEFRRRHRELEFAISTTTMTGYAVAKTRYREHMVFYAPLDFSWAVKNALRRLQPDLLVLAELELWPNLILAANQQQVPVAIVNGRLSDRSFRGYLRARWLISWLLGKLDCIAVQAETYAERFLQLGASPQSVTVTGSMKFDGAEGDRNNELSSRLRRLAGIASGDVVFLAGSTQSPEEAYALSTFHQLALEHPKLRLILVPRHPERFAEVAKLLEESGLSWQLRSELDQTPSRSDTRVLLVDRMGELRAWWGMADVAFVGGSFGEREGQNMIEPAAYGCAVCFGPRTRNFRDVVALLLEQQAAQVVNDDAELTAFARRCLQEPSFAETMGARARAVVASQAGATRRTADLLEPLFLPSGLQTLNNNAA
jgi:3-deoxy-D-manno-octulosonic-acid transferase